MRGGEGRGVGSEREGEEGDERMGTGGGWEWDAAWMAKNG